MTVRISKFQSATVISSILDPGGRHAVVIRPRSLFIVTFYRTVDDYTTKKVDSFKTFDYYDDAINAAQSWVESERV